MDDYKDHLPDIGKGRLSGITAKTALTRLYFTLCIGHRFVMSDVEFKELKYGFKYGDATIERHISDVKKGWVVLGLETSKRRLQIYVTKTGKVRIHDEDGKEWLPSSGG